MMMNNLELSFERPRQNHLIDDKQQTPLLFSRLYLRKTSEKKGRILGGFFFLINQSTDFSFAFGDIHRENIFIDDISFGHHGIMK